MAQSLSPRYSLLFPLLCFLSSAAAASVVHGGITLRRNQADALTLLRDMKLTIDSVGAVDTSDFKSSYENAEVVNELLVSDIKNNDKINGGLPGQPNPVKFDQYSGYITVDKSSGRAFFYYFVEADLWRRSSSPLVLWLNGGPGCSSLAYGAMQELGPFRVNTHGETLYENLYAWNRVSNVLFLESPAGVGFSYSNTSSDIQTIGDRKTASDNYKFLLGWLNRFPHYRKSEFYIAGESYAGHYASQLAVSIIRHNSRAGSRFINLKGILVGNAAINDPTDNVGMWDFFATHALISQENIQQIHKRCNFSSAATNMSFECEYANVVMSENIKGVDIFNIYAPLCDINIALAPNPSVLNYDPCSDAYVHAYLNRKNVQEAMHANVTNIEYEWQPCSNVIQNWSDSPYSVLGLYKELMEHNINVWLFSGDTDGRIPITSTQYSINAMNLTVSKKWHQWFSKGKVGGYKETYNELNKKSAKLTLATVKGAGHQVPTFKPIEALSLFTLFLNSSHDL